MREGGLGLFLAINLVVFFLGGSGWFLGCVGREGFNGDSKSKKCRKPV